MDEILDECENWPNWIISYNLLIAEKAPVGSSLIWVYTVLLRPTCPKIWRKYFIQVKRGKNC